VQSLLGKITQRTPFLNLGTRGGIFNAELVEEPALRRIQRELSRCSATSLVFRSVFPQRLPTACRLKKYLAQAAFWQSYYC